MASTSHVPRRRRRLLRRLRAAHGSVIAWDQALRHASPDSPNALVLARPAISLLILLEETLDSLQGRIAELAAMRRPRASARAAAGRPPCARMASPRPAPAVKRSATLLRESLLCRCVRACRQCGRALAVAFREALAAADAATARLLYAALRGLEKQIWLFDSRPPC